MFRTQTNAFDDVVAKATDETLTSENWEYMMDAWEKVNAAGEDGPKDAVAALIKRLAHRNANVQLYTLELAHGFTQNCGAAMHRELASRAFTDALLRLAGDRNTHQAVKSGILQKMADWSEMFRNDPGLGVMEQAFNRLKSANPNIHPPSKPTKREITSVDRQKEEEELQLALEISLKEKANAQAAQTASKAPAPATGQPGPSNSQPAVAAAAAAAAAAATPQPAPVTHTTAATVSRVRALYDFVPSETTELAFRKGDIIAVLESVYKDWWKGSLRGQTGIFPLNYVEKLADPTAEELQKDAQMEAEVFGQIKNVEKLLALLSTSEGNSAAQDNDEITTLYHSTLQIRPKLIELIGKYSQKKDDFVALNEKFIKARRDYELLLESSMSQTAAAHYGRPPAAANPYTYPPADAYGNPGQYYSNAPPHHAPSASPQSASPYGPPQHQQPKPAHGGPGGPPGGRQYYQQPHEEQQQPPQHREDQQQQQQQQQHQPPQGASAPFYVVGQMAPGGHLPHGGRTSSVSPAQAGHHYPPPQTAPSAPPSNAYKAPDGHPAPQELATSVYDTPIEPAHESSFTGGRPITPSASTSYPPYGYQRPLNVHQPSYPGADGPSPVTPQHPYPPLQGSPQPAQSYQAQTQAAAPPQSYQAYTSQRPPQPQDYYTGPQSQPQQPQQPPSEPPAGSPPPQDYYRQNELFLPNGSRAQS
ncbi:hypothetical protein BZA05DRAFT_436990 [Tricharina praecox]|uniref:uncharacterized protein n=1 Tax=Tricharina praecox TaxID=43433 RepID=UPI00221FF9A2|nr:uncharacterized protein BZA05DRAFT_436990 [Tricharina praecox]KAI5849760.1 hypothetical protein BZA05DRAFT_436990 [Tricharina praecox]